MTIHEYKEGDIVLFCDTGREHPKTYKFINDFEAHENIPVIRISYPGGFEAMLLKMQGIPNKFKRNCTRELKIRIARRYLVSRGIRSYETMIGFRADEPFRVKRHNERWKSVKTLFPLYTQGVTKEFINSYWSRKSYNLEIPSILGNCTLCFMKGKNAITAILREYPELAQPWIADEERDQKGHQYFEDISIKQMRDYAQNNLFKDFNLDSVEVAPACACTA